MDKLVKKFEDIFRANSKEPKPYEDDYSSPDYFENDVNFMLHRLAAYNAELTKQIAIEFAKHYLSGTIKKHYPGSIGDESKVEEYRTPEMDLLLGELISNGENNFNKFLEDYGK